MVTFIKLRILNNRCHSRHIIGKLVLLDTNHTSKVANFIGQK